MKKLLVASTLLAVTGVANAGLSFSELSTGVRTEVFNVTGLPTFSTGTTLSLGSLNTNETGTITFTYLGQESGYVNTLHLGINGQNIYESNPVGTSISAFVNTLGAIDFRFFENTGPANYAVNGGYWAPKTSIGLVAQNLSFQGHSYAYVLGYNDSAGVARLGDWDDLVVGVNFVPTTPVPEPETYAMLMAGLGIMGWTARRKRKQTV